MRPTLWLLALIWSICSTAGQEAQPHCVMVDGEPAEAEVPEGRAEWEKKGLDAHNELRKRHGAPALVHNKMLCRSAQWLANKIVAQWPDTQRLMHSSKFPGTTLQCGENLASVQSGIGKVYVLDAKRYVDIWYDEIENYDFSTGESKTGAVIGHFTQVVWKDSRQLCMAYTTSRDRWEYLSVIVAHYYPRGNYVGANKDNVQSLDAANKEKVPAEVPAKGSSLKMMLWLCTLTTLASLLPSPLQQFTIFLKIV